MGHQPGVGKKSCLRATPHRFLSIFRDTNTQKQTDKVIIAKSLHPQHGISSKKVAAGPVEPAAYFYALTQARGGLIAMANAIELFSRPKMQNFAT